MRRVYVIDDDAAMRESLEFLLGAADFDVVTFASAAGFLAAGRLVFGCVLSDIRMPDMDGIELLKRLKSQGSALPVILMTGHGDIPLAVEAMKLGAADFLEKPFEDDRLIAALRTALESRAGAAAGMSGAPDNDLAARVASLSERERQVLEGLIAGHSNKIIARELDISPRTVEVYRANLMAKMQAGSIPELIKFAIRVGIAAD